MKGSTARLTVELFVQHHFSGFLACYGKRTLAKEVVLEFTFTLYHLPFYNVHLISTTFFQWAGENDTS